MEIVSKKGKQGRKTLKIWGTHFQTIKTDISQGKQIGRKMGKVGHPIAE